MAGCVRTIVVLVVFLGFLIGYSALFGGPSVEVSAIPGGKRIDLRYLGEYCIGVRHLQLREARSKVVVWEVRDPRDTGICDFELRAGVNDARVAQHPDNALTVVVPKDPTFLLQRGKEYELLITANNGTRFTTGQVRFTL